MIPSHLPSCVRKLDHLGLCAVSDGWDDPAPAAVEPPPPRADAAPASEGEEQRECLLGCEENAGHLPRYRCARYDPDEQRWIQIEPSQPPVRECLPGCEPEATLGCHPDCGDDQCHPDCPNAALAASEGDRECLPGCEVDHDVLDIACSRIEQASLGGSRWRRIRSSQPPPTPSQAEPPRSDAGEGAVGGGATLGPLGDVYGCPPWCASDQGHLGFCESDAAGTLEPTAPAAQGSLAGLEAEHFAHGTAPAPHTGCVSPERCSCTCPACERRRTREAAKPARKPRAKAADVPEWATRAGVQLWKAIVSHHRTPQSTQRTYARHFANWAHPPAELQVIAAIDWLYGQGRFVGAGNPARTECQFAIWSAKSLIAKWDNLWSAVEADLREPAEPADPVGDAVKRSLERARKERHGSNAG